MQEILKRLEIDSSEIVSKKILEKYFDKGYAFLDYVYFANIVSKKLFESDKNFDADYFENLLLDGYKKTDNKKVFDAYKKAILEADFLLPDGIALQIFYFFMKSFGKISSKKSWLPNLNGTDFAPYFLDYLKNKLGKNNVKLILYGTYPHLLQKTKVFMEDKGFDVIYSQDGYTNLDWTKIDDIKKDERSVYVLLIARSTPNYPVQEIWSYANLEKIKKNRLLVMNQGGTFDFRVGEQKRAPMFIRKLRLEWLYRLISDPKRNYKKVLDTLLLFKYIFVYLLLKK